MALEREIETYRHKLSELLANEGKYVVIRGEEVLGVRDNLDEALRLGYDTSTTEPFLARRISKTEPVLFSSRSLRPCPSSAEPSAPTGRPSSC